MNNSHPNFPTSLHQNVAEIVLSYFADLAEVDSVLLLNSCARGQATPQSDLDMAVLVAPDLSEAQQNSLHAAWQQFASTDTTIATFRQSGSFANLHLDVINGRYTPTVWDDGGGPDDFEVEIGNHLAYSYLLSAPGPHFTHLQNVWLPYYDYALREQRLVMVRNACLYDLEHVPFFVERTLYFHAFDRLYKAFRQFLQLLFIKHQQYPIAYNKWIYDQVAGRLGLDDLYLQLLSILAFNNLDDDTMNEKAQALRQLINLYS